MRYRRNRTWLLALVTLLLVATLVLLTQVNLMINRQLPVGNDFLRHWVSLRAFLQEGINPYGAEAAQLAQQQAYGRAALPGEDPLRISTPLYSLFVYLPFLLIPQYELAQAIWMTALEAALVGLALLSVRLAGWRPGAIVMALFAIFTMLWFHSVWPLLGGDIIILLALALAGAVAAIRAGMDELAGLLLALTTIRLPVFLLALVFILLWAGAHRRWHVISWLFGVIFILGAFTTLLMPDWMLENARQIVNPAGYRAVSSLQQAVIVWLPAMGQRLGWGISGLLGLILLVEWFIFRKAEFRGFYWTLCLSLAVNQWIGLPTGPQNFIILLPALVLVFAVLEERWRKGGRWVTVLTMLGLFTGLWALFFNGPENAAGLQPSLGLFLPLPAYLLVTLYWVRWWAVRPPSVWFDLIYEQENPRRG